MRPMDGMNDATKLLSLTNHEGSKMYQSRCCRHTHTVAQIMVRERTILYALAKAEVDLDEDGPQRRCRLNSEPYEEDLDEDGPQRRCQLNSELYEEPYLNHTQRINCKQTHGCVVLSESWKDNGFITNIIMQTSYDHRIIYDRWEIIKDYSLVMVSLNCTTIIC